MTTTELMAMTKSEILGFCRDNNLNPVPNNIEKKFMAQLVMLQLGGAAAPVIVDEAEPKKPSGGFKFIHDEHRAKEEIRFLGDPTKSGRQPSIPLTCDTRRLTFRPGHWLPLLPEFKEVLEHTEVETFEIDPETQKEKPVIYRRFQYEIRQRQAA